MYADIRRIADHTLMLEGKNPQTFLLEPDISHVLLHKAEDTLYILDTGATPFFRQKLVAAAQSLRPFTKIKLFNSHGHPDHTGNNSVLHEIEAADKQHFISETGFELINYENYFIKDYAELAEAFYFLEGLDYNPQMLEDLYKQSGITVAHFAEKLTSLITLTEELQLPRVINPFFPKILVDLLLRHFYPLEPSIETMRAFEETRAQEIAIGGVTWTGWNFDDNVFALESRGHSPDGLIFYLPKVKVLYCGDETTVIPLFRDSKPSKACASMSKCLQMVEAGAVDALLDSHHQLFTSRQQMLNFLNEMTGMYEGLRYLISGMLGEEPAGLSVEQIYIRMKQLDNPALKGLFAWQFPVFAVFIKQLIYRYLVEMGCPVKGYGRKRLFMQPSHSD